MMRLQCFNSAMASLHSRIAVLETKDPIYDYALAVGHGLPPERPCDVHDFSGISARVDIIRYAKNYEPGAQTDWAIVRFPRIDNPQLVRYALTPFEDFENLEGLEVQFARARGLPRNTQSCSLSVLEFNPSLKRISHNCRGVPGQSGSPVTRLVEGESRLVGLNIGQLWMIESPRTGRPDRKGYINIFDEKMLAEVKTLIDEMP